MHTGLLVMFLSVATTPELIIENPRTELGTQFSYLEDVDGDLEFSDVKAESAGWIRSDQTTPNLGLTPSVFWFRLQFIPRLPNEDALILVLGYPLLDDVTVFQERTDGWFQETRGGDKLPFDTRHKDLRALNFEVPIEYGVPQTLWLRIQTQSSMQVPAVLATESSVYETSLRLATGDAFYYGIFFVMIVFNFFLIFSLKDKIYITYVCYLCLALGLQLALHGTSFQFFFADYPSLGNHFLLFCGYLQLFAIFHFTLQFNQLDEYSPRLAHSIRLLSSALLVGVALIPFASYSTLILPMTLVGFLIGPIAIGVAIIALRNDYRPARFFLVAWTAYLVGTVLFALKTAAILPANLFTSNAMQIGSALEVILLSLALGDRMRLVQDQRDASNHALIKSYQLLDVELQERERLVASNEALAAELSKAGEQLTHADKLATIGTLVAGVAHDIANPTNLALSAKTIIEDSRSKLENTLNQVTDGDTSSEAQTFRTITGQHLDSIQTAEEDLELAVERIIAINTAIRNQARNDREETTFSAMELVDECLVILKSKLMGITVVNDIDASSLLRARRSHFGQIVTNLVSNAADAIHEHENGAPRMIRLSAESGIPGSVTELSVEDSGPGIPKDIREKILEPFYTTKSVGKGTGLGMSIMLKILEEHDWNLEIADSSQCGGAKITLRSNDHA